MEGFRSCFGTVEDALSFGRYFYRYIYLGKQEIRLAVGEKGDRAVVYVQCDDPHQAAIQHRQTEDRLYDIVAEGAGMAEREKASFFTSGSIARWNMTRN